MPKPSLFVEVGQRIGRGTVTEIGLKIPRAGRPEGSALRAARLLCDCGNEYVTSLQALVGKRAENQRALSCGCLRRERQIAAVSTHGMSRKDGRRHPLMKIWEGMIHRCDFPNDPYYHIYGGRGIQVCERWHDPRLFAEDIEQDLGPRPKGWTLDRIDTDGNYEPGNVRWASAAMQAANRRPRTPAEAAASAVAISTARKERPYRTLTCQHCGGEYETRAVSSNQKFCSKKCKAAARRAAGVDNVEQSCHVCGGTYTASKYDKVRHCSHSCGATCQHAGGCSVAA